jgi:hypothetical protein
MKLMSDIYKTNLGVRKVCEIGKSKDLSASLHISVATDDSFYLTVNISGETRGLKVLRCNH